MFKKKRENIKKTFKEQGSEKERERETKKKETEIGKETATARLRTLDEMIKSDSQPARDRWRLLL